MNLQLIGVNHRSAPVEVRERFAIPEKKLPEALQSLVQYPGVQEGLIISTCNRVEVLAGLKNGDRVQAKLIEPTPEPDARKKEK